MRVIPIRSRVHTSLLWLFQSSIRLGRSMCHASPSFLPVSQISQLVFLMFPLFSGRRFPHWQVRLQGLEYMNDEPASMHVMYLQVRGSLRVCFLSAEQGGLRVGESGCWRMLEYGCKDVLTRS